MAKSKRPKILGEFTIDEVLPYVEPGNEDNNGYPRRSYKAGDTLYQVRMNSQRYFVFKNSLSCAVCGLVGTKFLLELPHDARSPHFNLYAEVGDDLELMNKDHIIPKSKGGLDILENYRTMCHTCNSIKGNNDLTNEQILEIRREKSERQKGIIKYRMMLEFKNYESYEQFISFISAKYFPYKLASYLKLPLACKCCLFSDEPFNINLITDIYLTFPPIHLVYTHIQKDQKARNRKKRRVVKRSVKERIKESLA